MTIFGSMRDHGMDLGPQDSDDVKAIVGVAYNPQWTPTT